MAWSYPKLSKTISKNKARQGLPDWGICWWAVELADRVVGAKAEYRDKICKASRVLGKLAWANCNSIRRLLTVKAVMRTEKVGKSDDSRIARVESQDKKVADWLPTR